jgi:hypothetical protein
VLPFGFGGKPVSGPGAIFHGIVPGDVQHRMVRAGDDRTVQPFRVRPIRAIHSHPPRRAGRGLAALRFGYMVTEDERLAGTLRLGAIFRRAYELAELPVGDGVPGNVERAQGHVAHGAFAVSGERAGDSLPIRNVPPSRGTMFSGDPVVARGRSKDDWTDVARRSKRDLVGAQQGHISRRQPRGRARARLESSECLPWSAGRTWGTDAPHVAWRMP